MDAGGEGAAGPPPRDELDGLLRDWHGVNAQRAAAGRDRLMAALGAGEASRDRGVEASSGPEAGPRLVFVAAEEDQRRISGGGARRSQPRWRRVLASPLAPLAAAAVVAVMLLPLVLPTRTGVVATVTASAPATNIVMAPEAGLLDAYGENGQLLGPCVLRHTDVQAEITGRFSRVTVRQEYKNGNPEPIEGVYTFPLSERASVDRMRMTIGDRVIEGEVEERDSARAMYEASRDSGRTASLLEQERPNVFTQSVANIAPGATVAVELSYVEEVRERGGEFCFDFPTVVSPRFVAGSGTAGGERGLVLSAPAEVVRAERGDGAQGERSPRELGEMLAGARAIEPVAPAAPADASKGMAAARRLRGRAAESEAGRAIGPAGVWYDFTVEYPDGSREPGTLLADGRGEVGGRWFACDAGSDRAGASTTAGVGGGRAPTMRDGHDLSISVVLDSGGPGILGLESPLHRIVQTPIAKNSRGEPERVHVALDALNEIPNRDFELRWKQGGERIGTRVFANTGEKGNFFCVQLEPPARVADEVAMPRELEFVVDTSESMRGKPLAVARRVIERAIDGMRPQDKFDVIGFGGAGGRLWDLARPGTAANREEALKAVASWEGEAGAGGATLLSAIDAAAGGASAGVGGRAGSAAPISLDELAKVPPDGRSVRVVVDDGHIGSNRMEKGGELVDPTLQPDAGEAIGCTSFVMPEAYLKRSTTAQRDGSIRLELLLSGTWGGQRGERVLQVSSAEMYSDSGVRPVRVAIVLTNGDVGNEYEIIEATRRHRAEMRVFPFGIGNSVDRSVIERMASAGGGEPEYVFLSEDSDAQVKAAVDRFERRMRTPVLTDVSVAFEGVQPVDVLPAAENMPDLWGDRALTILGRYTRPGPGTMTVRAQAATGKWEEKIPIVLPDKEMGNTCLPTLWARGMVDELVAKDLLGMQRGVPDAEMRAQVVRLGETFNVETPFTSFVAVDKLRVTVEGKPRLVRVPVEPPPTPAETTWEEYFRAVPGARTGTMVGQSLAELRDKAVLGKTEARAPAKAETEALRLNREGLERVLRLAEAQRESGRDGAPADQVTPSSGVEFRIVERAQDRSAEAGKDESASAPAMARPSGGGRGAPPRGGKTVVGAELKKTTPAPAAVPAPRGPSVGAPSSAGGAVVADDLASKERRDEDAMLARNGAGAGRGGESRLGFAMRGGNGADALRRNVVDSASPGNARPVVGEESRSTSGDVDRPLTGTELNLAMANDSPGVAMTGCVSALAAAQLAEEGRDDEARRVACQSANVLQNAAGLNGNFYGAANAGSTGEWQAGANAVNIRANAQVLSVEAAAAQLCGTLNGKATEEQRKAAIEQARAAATAGYLE
ncbi:MAG TPA: VIT and VWA domain-containing protein, partial [Phycisphaerales bacterium]|nr:VIT and VWA domain-containing protein [Phycisphaerales bacterium]